MVRRLRVDDSRPQRSRERQTAASAHRALVRSRLYLVDRLCQVLNFFGSRDHAQRNSLCAAPSGAGASRLFRQLLTESAVLRAPARCRTWTRICGHCVCVPAGFHRRPAIKQRDRGQDSAPLDSAHHLCNGAVVRLSTRAQVIFQQHAGNPGAAAASQG